MRVGKALRRGLGRQFVVDDHPVVAYVGRVEGDGLVGPPLTETIEVEGDDLRLYGLHSCGDLPLLLLGATDLRCPVEADGGTGDEVGLG